MVNSQLALHRYATGRASRVVTALTMLKSHLFGYYFFQTICFWVLETYCLVFVFPNGLVWWAWHARPITVSSVCYHENGVILFVQPWFIVVCTKIGAWILCCSYKGQVSAALVLGGVDVTGPHLHAVSGGQLSSFVCCILNFYFFHMSHLHASLGLLLLSLAQTKLFNNHKINIERHDVSGLSTRINRYTPICHNGFRFIGCHVRLWIQIQGKSDGNSF